MLGPAKAPIKLAASPSATCLSQKTGAVVQTEACGQSRSSARSCIAHAQLARRHLMLTGALLGLGNAQAAQAAMLDIPLPWRDWFPGQPVPVTVPRYVSTACSAKLCDMPAERCSSSLKCMLRLRGQPGFHQRYTCVMRVILSRCIDMSSACKCVQHTSAARAWRPHPTFCL